MKKRLQLSICYKDTNKKSLKLFKKCLFCTICIFSAYMVSICIFNGQWIFFILQYESFSHTIHLRGFQLLLHSQAINMRLELLNKVSLEDNDDTEKKLQHLKQALVQIFEVAQENNKCFSLSLLLTFTCLYGIIVNNLQWMGISFLGAPHAETQGNVFFFISIK